MKKLLLFPVLLVLFPGSALAASIELGFNDTSAQLQGAYTLRSDDYGTSRVEGRLLYNDPEETKLASGGLVFHGSPGNVPGFSLGIGGLVYGGRTDDQEDILALGVGGRLNYAPPALGGFAFSGKIFYAPRIFSGMDTERLLETGVRGAYAVTPKVRLFVEYQNIGADFDQRGDWTIDEEIRVGFAATF